MSADYIESDIIEPTAVAVREPQQAVAARMTRDDALHAMENLKVVRSFIAEELKDGLDYGVIPGTGNKKNMLLPGAQKVIMFFNSRPEYVIERVELGGGHVEFIVSTTLYSRTTGQKVGAGVGSCSTMEGKYRYRKAERTCPQCGSAAIIKGKAEYGGGWVCFAAKGGCKAKFKDGDPAIEKQDAGKVENPDIYDTRNTVLKMAKKRSLVDASIGLGCLSELFTQDIEDIYDLGAGAPQSEGRASGPAQTPPPIPPTSAPAPAPASNTPEQHDRVIQLVSLTKEWAFNGQPLASFRDDKGSPFKFTGDLVTLAKDSLAKEDRDGYQLKVRFYDEQLGRGKQHVVVKAKKAEGGDPT